MTRLQCAGSNQRPRSRKSRGRQLLIDRRRTGARAFEVAFPFQRPSPVDSPVGDQASWVRGLRELPNLRWAFWRFVFPSFDTRTRAAISRFALSGQCSLVNPDITCFKVSTVRDARRRDRQSQTRQAAVAPAPGPPWRIGRRSALPRAGRRMKDSSRPRTHLRPSRRPPPF